MDKFKLASNKIPPRRNFKSKLMSRKQFFFLLVQPRLRLVGRRLSMKGGFGLSNIRLKFDKISFKISILLVGLHVSHLLMRSRKPRL